MDETTARGTAGRRSTRSSSLHARTRSHRQHRIVQSSAEHDVSCAALLASLVHELRTPVTALATGSELLLDDLDSLSRDDLQRIVETMHRGAIWLQGLIENVLYAATLAEGGIRLYPRALNLVELVRDILP